MRSFFWLAIPNDTGVFLVHFVLRRLDSVLLLLIVIKEPLEKDMARERHKRVMRQL